MSNSRIAARLEALVADLESERIDISSFTREFLGHIEAMDRVSYSDLKQAQVAHAQLEIAIENGQAELVDVTVLVAWLRSLLSKIPGTTS